jgi:fructose-bisphosphate aldolase class I
MFEETLYQSSKDGKPFVDILNEQGIKPGIKVDTGLQVLPGTNGETATQGLDGLGGRMKAYREQARLSHRLPPHKRDGACTFINW